MSDTVLEDLERFFEELPPTVRDDLSFMMVMLSDDSIIVHEVEEVYEAAARGLLGAQTRIGRIAKLINAVSVFDVYFAMDARKRFDLATRTPEPEGHANTSASLMRDRYADQVEAIHAAGRRWAELRRTTLDPAAIAAALTPPDATRRRNRRMSNSSRQFAAHAGDAPHDSIS